MPRTLAQSNQFRAYLLAVSGPQMAWGIFWVVFVFSVSAASPTASPFWVSVIYSIGPATTALSALVLPLFYRQRALRIFLLTQVAEVLIIPLYIASLGSSLLVFFAVLVGINGIFDELGEGVLASVFSTLASPNMKESISLQRTSSLLFRFFGYLVGGVAYTLLGNYSYLIMCIILVISVLSSVLIRHGEILVAFNSSSEKSADGTSLLTNVKVIGSKFMHGVGLRFTLPFIIGSLLDSVGLVIITLLLVNSLRISAVDFGALSAILLIASAAGAFLFRYLRFSKRTIIVLGFIVSGVSFLLYAFVPTIVIFFIFGALVNFMGSMAQTVLSQSLYEGYDKNQVGIINQIMVFLTTIPFAIGNLLGGFLGMNNIFGYALLFLSPIYFLNALFANIIIPKGN